MIYCRANREGHAWQTIDSRKKSQYNTSSSSVLIWPWRDTFQNKQHVLYSHQISKQLLAFINENEFNRQFASVRWCTTTTTTTTTAITIRWKKADRQTNGLKNKHSWLISWPRWAVKSVKHKHCAQCGLSGPIIGSVLCCFRWHIGKVKKKGETTEGASFTFLESDQLRTTGVVLITANWRWVQRQQVALLLHCLAQEGTSRPNYRLLVTFPGKPTLVASRDAIN